MNEKEMTLHIKALTKVIEKQTEYAEQLMRRCYNMEKELSILQRRLARCEGIIDG
jgi:predicted RNase H-like nuclease (RuvC/YqgF family)